MQRVRNWQWGIGMMLCYLNAHAGLDVMQDMADGYYGNAQVAPFREAIDGTVSISQQDKAFLDSVESLRVTKRYYWRLLIGRPEVKLTKIRGVYTAPLPATTANPVTIDYCASTPGFCPIKQRVSHVKLIYGKRYEDWAFEGQLLLTKAFKIQRTNFLPCFTGTCEIDAKANMFGLLAHAEYIIPPLFDFMPPRLQIYLNGGAGMAFKITETMVTDTSPGVEAKRTSRRRFNPIAELGVGMRYQVTDRFLADVTYRFTDLGKTSFKVGSTKSPADIVQGTITATRTTAIGPFVGFTYQLAS